MDGFLVALLYGALVGAGLFWLNQFMRVVSADNGQFESHAHRLLWFVVVLLFPLFGAIWFFVWSRKKLAMQREELTRSNLQQFAASLRDPSDGTRVA